MGWIDGIFVHEGAAAYTGGIALVLVFIGYALGGIGFGKRGRRGAQARDRRVATEDIAAADAAGSAEPMRRQREQTFTYMKKAERLERILQIGIKVQRRHSLEEVLQMAVELVRENLGFDTVVLRLLNRQSFSFETRAHVGVSDERRDEVVSYRLPMAAYERLIDPDNRVSQSFLLRAQGPDEREAGRAVVTGGWKDGDSLLVPLKDEGNETIGYLSVENPVGSQVSVADTIENIETIAALMVIAIRNAELFTELRDKNEKLQAYADKVASLSKMKSDFIATVSHEFRTPLTSIKAYSETLLGNADDVDRELLKQFLVIIDEESTRLMSTIEDILDFSQMESGAMRFEREQCDVRELLQGAERELSRHFDSCGVTLQREVAENPVNAWVEKDMIKQLITNLLHNAAKFSNPGGTVKVRIDDDVVAVRIQVEDQGRGIPETELGKVFEQFHQVDASSTREHNGTGLGLAICKNIVDWHDGRIWAESVPGSGARFVAIIPKKEVVVKCHADEFCGAMRKFEIERFLELLVETAAEMTHAHTASVLLMDERGEELRIGGAIGLSEEIVEKARIRLGEGIAGRVAAEGRSWLVKDIEKDERVGRANNSVQYTSNSFMSVPMCFEEETIGVINVASPAHSEAFDELDCALLEQLAHRLAIAVVKLRSYAYASVNYERVRDALRSILDSQRFIDRFEDDHLTRIVVRAARRLGLQNDAIARLRYVMNVYDLGLSKVGYHIVKKPGDLSPRERLEMKRHVELGAELLAVVETGPDIRDIILHHHENFDGSGYPDGLRGEAIPIEARIIRVADSLRALVSKRPYQRQYTIDEAREVIAYRAGTCFDPTVVESFLEALGEVVVSVSNDVTERQSISS